MKWFQRNKWAAAGAILSCTITSAIIAGTSTINVNDNTGTSKTYAVTTNGGGSFVTQTAVCDGTAAANCAAVSAGGAVSVSAISGSNFVAPVAIGSAPTLTVSATGSTNNVNVNGFTATVTTSPTAGANNVTINGATIPVTTSPSSGSNFVAPVAIGSAPTLVTSNSSTALVQPVNCINGCTSGTVTINETYNQVPATLVSGGTSGLQADQQGSLKVNIVSQLAATLVTSPQAGSVAWPPGTPTGLAAGSTTAGQTGSIIMGEGSTAPIAVASGATSFLLTDLLSQLRVTAGASTTGGCTSSYVTASTTNIFTQIKSGAGTLCWLRVINASAVTATVRFYDTAINGNLACQGSTQPISYDLMQPNTTSPGLVGNLGTAGMAFSNGLGLCITGSSGGTFPFQDTTSLTTNALFVNIGVK